jgi:hypothetical protein
MRLLRLGAARLRGFAGLVALRTADWIHHIAATSAGAEKALAESRIANINFR